MGYTGIMENEMETTTVFWGYRRAKRRGRADREEEEEVKDEEDEGDKGV